MINSVNDCLMINEVSEIALINWQTDCLKIN